MNQFYKEELHETLAELQKSRQREKKQAEENEAILAAISALRDAQNRQQIFNALIYVLQKYIDFDDALILSKTPQESQYRCLLSTDKAFRDTFWNKDIKFSRALAGEYIVLYDPQKLPLFKQFNHLGRDQVNSALLCGFSSEISQSVCILIGRRPGQLNAEAKSTLSRLMPLVVRALQDIEQKEKLQHMVELRTRELANNRQRFMDFAQSVGDWLWETDEKFNVTYLSSSSNEFINMISGNILDALDKLDQQDGSTKIASSIGRLEHFVDIDILQGERYISMSGKPYYANDGTFLGYRGTARDVTSKRKQVKALKQAQSEALQASKAKSEFLAVMSHEIRTPLNTVLGLIDVLKDSAINQEQSTALKQMESSAELLLVLISDILDLSKIESGHFLLDNQRANFRDIVNNSVNHFRPQAKSKQLELIVEIPPDIPQFILVDPTRLSQVFFNLVGNAVKFTAQGEVKVIVSQEKNELTIYVSDTGIGIPYETLNSLFSAFKQADSSITRKYGGTGLGLAISKHLIELMGGSISVDSLPGQGSQFVIKLPVTQVPSEKQQTEGKQKNVSCINKQILLVEDCKTNQMVINLLLNKLGHNVSLANNGRDALQLLEDQDTHFDLIFMDLSMPVMDGLEATAEIRRRKINTPIIALTAHAMESDREKCISAGMNGFVTKPVRTKELEETINGVFAQHSIT